MLQNFEDSEKIASHTGGGRRCCGSLKIRRHRGGEAAELGLGIFSHRPTAVGQRPAAPTRSSE